VVNKKSVINRKAKKERFEYILFWREIRIYPKSSLLYGLLLIFINFSLILIIYFFSFSTFLYKEIKSITLAAAVF
jgi:hypothetical protein